MTVCINSDHLMRFIRDEASERAGHMKPSDPPTTAANDTGFIEGLEVVAAYVLRAMDWEAA